MRALLKRNVGITMMVSVHVKDVLSRKSVTVHEEDTLSHSLAMFEKGIPVLAVLDGDGKYKGVLARRWIIRSRLDPSTTKVKTLMRRAPTVKLDDAVSKVARLMIESGVTQLPAYHGDELLGFVTDESVIRGAVMGSWGNIKVEEIMTRDIFVVEKDDPVGAVLHLFREHDISHVPVVSKGKLVGIITIHDIIKYIYEPLERAPRARSSAKLNVLKIPVRSLMVKPVITVTPETQLQVAEKKMHDFNISSLIVMRRGTIEGIATKRDYLEPLAQTGTDEPKLTIQFSARDVKIENTQKTFMINEFNNLVHKFGQNLKVGTLFAYLKTHGDTHKGQPLIHCRLHFRTMKGSFFSSSEGWDVEQIFHLALNRLETQLLRHKEISYKTELAGKYLEHLNFSSSGLY